MKFVFSILIVLSMALTMPVAQAVPTLPGSTTKDSIEGWCNDKGGTYWPPGKESSTYGCILPDGSVVVCGGSTQGCTPIDAASGLPPSRLPLEIIKLTLDVQTKTSVRQIEDKLDLLELMVDDLALLVEDECEPPIFVP